MTANEAQNQLRHQLMERYDAREAAAIAYTVIEEITGLTRSARLIHDPLLDDKQVSQWQEYLVALLMGKPMQYVLGHAWFMGEKFTVNDAVLIPRPETEELVSWLLEGMPAVTTVLDIGTGSGCIPVMISKRRPGARVMGIDISDKALAVARQNASALGATVQFLSGDFLLPHVQRSIRPVPDIIISNPPYIPLQDRHTMAPHVVEHEPHLALFVPDHDALLFYREIIGYASREGVREIFFETHYQLAGEVAALGEDSGFSAEVRKDLSGLNRMVRMVNNVAMPHYPTSFSPQTTPS